MKKRKRMGVEYNARIMFDTSGKLQTRISDEHARQKYSGFLLGLGDTVKEHGAIPVKVTIEVMRDEDAIRARKRASYFAYLNKVVSEAQEGVLEPIYSPSDNTPKRKVDALHYYMKREYCRAFHGMWKIERDDETGKEVKKVFSVSDAHSHVTGDTLLRYFAWAKNLLEEKTGVDAFAGGATNY